MSASQSHSYQEGARRAGRTIQMQALAVIQLRNDPELQASSSYWTLITRLSLRTGLSHDDVERKIKALAEGSPT